MGKALSYIFYFLMLTGCVEPFDIPLEVLDTESILVVEATLTDELKPQTILLSRSSDFGRVNERDSVYDPVYPVRPTISSLIPENNAMVMVKDDQGNVFDFKEGPEGRYTSVMEFAAQINVNYVLTVQTLDGTLYRSDSERFDSTAQIDSVYAIRDLNSDGRDGVFIYVDGQSEDDASYFRYSYEETYKIIAPEWREKDFVLTNYDPCALPQIAYDLEILTRDNEEGKVCFKTDRSDTNIQASTLGLAENILKRFPVRFINRENYILSYRYSILVKQYVQSETAFNYYRSLNSFSSSENIFSQIQPGFLSGNIRVENDGSKSVIGFFDVSQVTKKRLFFDHDDLFPGEPLPEYPIACIPTAPPLDHGSYCFTGMTGGLCPLSIVESVNIGLISYYGLNEEGIGRCPGPYLVTNRACGDCSVLGNSEVPDFWID